MTIPLSPLRDCPPEVRPVEVFCPAPGVVLVPGLRDAFYAVLGPVAYRFEYRHERQPQLGEAVFDLRGDRGVGSSRHDVVPLEPAKRPGEHSCGKKRAGSTSARTTPNKVFNRLRAIPFREIAFQGARGKHAFRGLCSNRGLPDLREQGKGGSPRTSRVRRLPMAGSLAARSYGESASTLAAGQLGHHVESIRPNCTASVAREKAGSQEKRCLLPGAGPSPSRFSFTTLRTPIKNGAFD